MKLEGMLFREEESVAGYLGVHIDRKDDGTIHLTQKGLADKIVDSLHLSGDDITSVDTPCTTITFLSTKMASLLMVNSVIHQ
jgi:hypothetical protein